MKKIVFAKMDSQHKSHTLTASLNMDMDLVFDNGEFCDDGSRVVDDTLTVNAKYKRRLLQFLCHAFAGISDTRGEAEDERLFSMLERMAHSGHWRSLDEVETWLMDRGIPFTKQRRDGG